MKIPDNQPADEVREPEFRRLASGGRGKNGCPVETNLAVAIVLGRLRRGSPQPLPLRGGTDKAVHTLCVIERRRYWSKRTNAVCSARKASWPWLLIISR